MGQVAGFVRDEIFPPAGQGIPNPHAGAILQRSVGTTWRAVFDLRQRGVSGNLGPVVLRSAGTEYQGW